MIRCLIVDDEKPAREELKYLLQDYEDINIIGEAKHGIEAIDLNRKMKPDLIFLDIKMPKLNGIEVAKELSESKNMPMVVFVTAFDQYAIKAFEVNAIDYLVKPICEERLNITISKVRNNFDNKNNIYESNLKLLLEQLKHNKIKELNKICLYSNGTLIPLDAGDIIYATIENKNTVIITRNNKYEYSDTLSHLEEKLNLPIFFRSHRSYLINIDYIEEIEPWFNSTYQIKMKYTEERIPVSRRQVKDFKKLLNID